MDSSPIQHLSILLVDDEQLIRDLLRTLFSKEQNTCVVAEDGTVGFQMVIEDPYDFILMDIEMPKMNGVDCIKAIRQVDPKVPILIMSGYAENEKIQRGLEAGANGFIHKPFEFKDLLRKMSGIIDEQHKE